MNTNEAAHQAQFIKESLEILSEFSETDRLIREQNAEGLLHHINSVALKYPLEASVYNITHPYLPRTFEQAGEDCNEFLRGVLFAKVGEALARKLLGLR